MFAYLSKKIGIPGCQKLDGLSWQQEESYIGVGGSEKGVMKVIKLGEGQQGLIENVSLQGHNGSVYIVRWNEKYYKLTTGDSEGKIVVWNGQQEPTRAGTVCWTWTEEMINNRGKSRVADMKWSKDGSKICISYEDGAVIIGSVEGSRLWGKDYKHQIKLVEWAPDGKQLVIGTSTGELMVYDEMGQLLNQIKVFCLQNVDEGEKSKLKAVEWFQYSKQYTDDTVPGLVIAYECGRLQLMMHERDTDPILIDTTLSIQSVCWNPSGSIFCVGGYVVESESKAMRGVMQLYSNQGIHLRTTRIPASGDMVSKVSFEGTGLRLVMAVGNALFFANIKPDYKWGYMQNNTLVFGFQKQDRVDYNLIFWQIEKDKKVIKQIKYMVNVKAVDDHCCVVNKVGADLYQLQLMNSIGSPLDTKLVNIEPEFMAMSETHVVVASQDHIYCWQYKNQVSRLTTFNENKGGEANKLSRELAWFVDEVPQPDALYDLNTFNKEGMSEDPLCGVTVTESGLFIGRQSGCLQKYSLPYITQEWKQFLRCRPQSLFVNANATRLAIIDSAGLLQLYQFHGSQGDQNHKLNFEKKDVWDFKWAKDDPLAFVFMEKSRMNIVKDIFAEEPIVTDCYPCHFENMTIKAITLDEIMKIPDGELKHSDNYIHEFQTKVLKDIIQSFKQNQNNLQEIYDCINESPHQKLWQMLVKQSLEQLDFQVAEKALLKLEDYMSLKIIKRIQMIGDKNIQKAEILSYYKNYDEAEELLMKIERVDLAIQLRMRLGEWQQVVNMIQEMGGFDQILNRAYVELGHQHLENQQYKQAVYHYEKANHFQGLIQAYQADDDFEGLQKIVGQLSEGDSELLQQLANLFEVNGLCDKAVECWLKLQDYKRAVDCCVLLKNWTLAMELAEKHNFIQIEGLLGQYAQQLISQKKKLEAAELFRRANRNHESARILSQIGQDLTERDANPLWIKKLYVMSALEVEQHKQRIFDQTITGQVTNQKTLDTLITSDIQSAADKVLNNPWRGAEAWHFMLLAQKQLYRGEYPSALKTARRLVEYELELDLKKIYSILTLAGYYARNYKECSRSLVKLESMQSLTNAEKLYYEQIAVEIFTHHQPDQTNEEYLQCMGKNCGQKVSNLATHCKFCGANFQPCVVSGQSILTKEYFTCKGCKHRLLYSEIERLGLKNCSLCHNLLKFK